MEISILPPVYHHPGLLLHYALDYPTFFPHLLLYQPTVSVPSQVLDVARQIFECRCPSPVLVLEAIIMRLLCGKQRAKGNISGWPISTSVNILLLSDSSL